MKTISLLFAVCAPTFAQTGVLNQGYTSRPGYSFHYQTLLEPPSPPMADEMVYGSGYHSDNGHIFKAFIDYTHHIYFGYEVQVTPVEPGKYRLAFFPLTFAPEDLRQFRIDPKNWNKLDIPVPAGRPLYPFRDEPDVVRDLDVVAVDLLVNPSSQQKIVDYIVIQKPGGSWSWGEYSGANAGRLRIPTRDPSSPPSPPRDFALEDAALRIVDGKISVNTMAVQYEPGEVSGAYLWFYVPDQGRYIFTLLPQAGFQKAGQVKGTTLSFKFGRDSITILSAKPIVSNDAVFNIYVRVDTTTKSANFALAGGPKW